MDGARFANACASLGCTPAEMTWQAGVDVLCFGGTKNGMAVGEAILFFNKALAEDFDYRCKQAGQLASKMRYLSSQWAGMLQDDAWLRRAAHANDMARLLAERIDGVAGAHCESPEANAVFVDLPRAVADAMRARGWSFYSFIGGSGNRLMCSWNTQVADIERFASDLRALAAG
jgi:threonine aldolase